MRSETHFDRQLAAENPCALVNVSGEAIPPRSFARIANIVSVGDAPGSEIYIADKPNGDPTARYLVTGPQETAVSGFGVGRMAAPLQVDNGGGAPAVGAEWGPVANQWAASPAGSGFIVLGNGAGWSLVTRARGGDSGPDHPIVSLHNQSALGVTRGQISGLTAARDVPGDGETPGEAFYARVKPFDFTDPTAGAPFAVALVDIAGVVGQTVTSGDAACLGVVDCQIDFTDEAHGFAEVDTGNRDNLVSAATGRARILWRQNQGLTGAATLGMQWARLYIGNTATAEGGDGLGLTFGYANSSGIPGASRWEWQFAPAYIQAAYPNADPTDVFEEMGEGDVIRSSADLVNRSDGTGYGKLLLPLPASVDVWLNPSRVGIAGDKRVGAVPMQFGDQSHYVIIWEDCG